MPAPNALILLVDDDPAVGAVLGALLSQAGMRSQVVRSGLEALATLDRQPFDAVLADVRMPGMDGLALLRRIVSQQPDLPVVLLTAHGTVPLAVEAIRAGAADFLLKPFDREEIVFVLRKVLAGRQSNDEAVPGRPSEGRMIGSSAAMREVNELIRRAATGNATVLIRGESGTGKELIARAIHEQSPRRKGPFVKLHCAALPDSLLESELFGYEKGAFTGAASRKPGRIELAHEGTLFLDEIGDVTPATQVKLLRVIQERCFERLGGQETLTIDVRFVAATHRDLDAMVAEARFREDLYYRLNVVPLFVPPLRLRAGDVEELARHFVRVHGRANGKPNAVLQPEALAILASQAWPGNIRQLENFIERLIVLSDSQDLSPADVMRELSRAPAISGRTDAPTGPTNTNHEGGLDLATSRRNSEREALTQALLRANNNRTVAARLLGVSRRTLYTKLEEHGLL